MQWKETYPLRSQLSSPLILSVSQQFNDTALIWSKTDNFAGDFTDECGAAGGLALRTGDSVLRGVEGSGFLFVHTTLVYNVMLFFSLGLDLYGEVRRREKRAVFYGLGLGLVWFCLVNLSRGCT